MEPYENCADRRTRGCAYPLCQQTGETDCSVITECPRDETAALIEMGEKAGMYSRSACHPHKVNGSARDNFAGVGVLVIVAERRRQIEKEGFDAEHDKRHQPDELAMAGAVYAWSPPRYGWIRQNWPFEGGFKPGIPWNNGARLVDTPEARLADYRRAGALIAAAIDLLVEDNPHLEETVAEILEESVR